MAEDARELVSRGFDALKLKISGDPELDTLRVAKVREAVADDIFIKVDANESYDVKSAIRAAKKLVDFGVEIFEQPVPRAQIEALMEVKRNSPIKVEADQSAVSVSDAAALHLAVSCDAVSSLCELGEFENVADDPFSGLEIDAGILRVPSGEGLGVTRLKS